LDKTGDLGEAFKQFTDARKEDVDTICTLAMDNYKEMASKVTQRLFLIRKKIDYFLGKYVNGKYFRWIPFYSLISFRDEISYSHAVEIRDSQDKFLNNLELGTVTGLLVFAVAKGWSLWQKTRK
jgi:kynurenine 3-monooxygenase